MLQMYQREFLASEEFFTMTPAMRFGALNRARILSVNLHLDLRRVRFIQSLMYEFAGGQERARAIVDLKYRRETFLQHIDVTTQEVKVVKYLFFQLHKWYCAVPVCDIPVIDYPSAVFILQTFVMSFVAPRLRDIKAFERFRRLKGLLRNDAALEGTSAIDKAKQALYRRGVLMQLGISKTDEELQHLDVVAKIIHSLDCGEIREDLFPDNDTEEEGHPCEDDLKEEAWKDVLPQETNDYEELWRVWYDMRLKLSQLLLDPTIDKPKEASRLLEILALEKNSQYHDWQVTFSHHPHLIVYWIDARVLSGYFDGVTMYMLDMALHSLLDIPSLEQDRTLDPARMRFTLYLPNVEMQTRLGEPREQQFRIRKVVDMLRNPVYRGNYSESVLRQILARQDQPLNPIYEMLGGEDWFLSRRALLLTKRERRCANCLKPSGERRLKQCAKCEWAYYCSTSCQKQHWPVHKERCSRQWEYREREKSCPKWLVKRLGVWNKWLTLAHGDIFLHALALHRHPERGRTHVVIREVAYVPHAHELNCRFTTIKCGVFRIDQARGDIERLLGRVPGGPLDICQSMGGGPELATKEVIPLNVLSYGSGVNASINTVLVTPPSLTDIMYEPRWRNIVNRWGEEPPAPLTLPSGILDAEHDW